MILKFVLNNLRRGHFARFVIYHIVLNPTSCGQVGTCQFVMPMSWARFSCHPISNCEPPTPPLVSLGCAAARAIEPARAQYLSSTLWLSPLTNPCGSGGRMHDDDVDTACSHRVLPQFRKKREFEIVHFLTISYLLPLLPRLSTLRVH